MIKKAFLEVIQKRVNPIDESNQFGVQYIEGVVDVFWQQYALNYMNKYGSDPGFFTKTYSTGALSTDSSGRYYADLPESIIKLPQTPNSSGSEGVVSVYEDFTTAANASAFKPIRERDYKSLINLPTYSTGTEYYFWVRYDKIFFSDNISAGIESGGVEVDLMVPFSKYSYTEDLPIPTDLEKLLIVDVVGYIQGTPFVDQLNNNRND